MTQGPLSWDDINKLTWRLVIRPDLEQQIETHNRLAKWFGWDEITVTLPD